MTINLPDKIRHLENKYYLSKADWKNGTTQFHDLVVSNINTRDIAEPPSDRNTTTILEIGPGPQNKTTLFLTTKCARLDGLDIDERAKSNPDLDRIFIYDGNIFPVKDAAYDLVVADYVMEHVQDPLIMLKQIHRVLRPGGQFVFRTPNIYHYVSIISRFTPHQFHLAFANKARNISEDAIDPYPTHYRFNSTRKIAKLAAQISFREIDLRMVEKQPSYLSFHPWAYRLGIGYERMVNAIWILAQFRSNILGVLKKNA